MPAPGPAPSLAHLHAAFLSILPRIELPVLSAKASHFSGTQEAADFISPGGRRMSTADG
jgi:hypothetical protein